MKKTIILLVLGNMIMLLLISSRSKVLNYLDVVTSHDTVRPFCIDKNIPTFGDLDIDTKMALANVSYALSGNPKLVAVVSPVINGNWYHKKYRKYYSNLATDKISNEIQVYYGIQKNRIFTTPPNVEFMKVCSNYNLINCNIMVCNYSFYLKNRKAI